MLRINGKLLAIDAYQFLMYMYLEQAKTDYVDLSVVTIS